MIKQGGLAINGDLVTDPHARLDAGELQNGDLLLRAGKKRFMRVVLR
jgi:tyrosyl-tRNA synthetase